MDQSPPKRTIGKYEILAPLGRGAMGVVYQAKDPEIGRLVAVKTLRATLSGQGSDAEKAFERFRNEARSAGNLRHPNIITVFDVGRDGATPYLVMDHVSGRGLDELIASRNRLAPDYALRVLSQIALGLDYAHRQGVIHRDIKPSNIMIDAQDHAYILDFGIARLPEELAPQDPVAKPGTVVGTPGYMAPEHILNEPLDARADLFSFAVVAYECFTGRRPFTGTTVNEILSAILNGKPTPLTSIAPELPLSLEAEFDRALNRSRALRFGSAQDFVGALAAALKLPLGASLPGGSAAQISAGASGTEGSKHAASPWDSVADAERIPRPAEGVVDPVRPHQRAKANQEFGVPPTPSTSAGRFVFWSVVGTAIVASSVLLYSQQRKNAERVPTAAPVLAQDQATQAIAEPFAALIKPASSLPAPQSDPRAWTAEQRYGLLLEVTTPEPIILELLNDPQSLALPHFPDAAVRQLESDSYLVRIAATKALAARGDVRVIPNITKLLQDYDPLVRGHAARALGLLHDLRAVPYLTRRRAEEQSPEVLRSIDAALESIRDRV